MNGDATRPRLLGDRDRRPGLGQSGLYPQHAGPAHRSDRPRAAAVEIIDFAPAPCETLAGPTGRWRSCASCGRWRDRPAYRVRLRPAADWGARRGRAHLRLQPHPLSVHRRDPAPDHRLPGVPHPGGAGFPAGEAHGLLPRPGRGLRSGGRRRRRGRAGPHRRLLAGLGPDPLYAAGVAGGGDPRGDHAEALRLRGDRRHRRRHDDLDARVPRERAATGTTATAGSATPTMWCRR